MKNFFPLLFALGLAASASGQQLNPSLVTGSSDFIGLEAWPIISQVVEAGPNSLYWIGASNYTTVDHPALYGVWNDFANIFFIKYDQNGDSISSNFLRGSSSVVDAFSFAGGLTIMGTASENVEAHGEILPINTASKMEFLIKYDSKCRYVDMVPIWDNGPNQSPRSVVQMDKRSGAIYVAGTTSEPYNLVGRGMIGEEWEDYLYVIRYNRDLVFDDVFIAGMEQNGEYGNYQNIVISPGVNGNVVITGIYEGDRAPIIDGDTLTSTMMDYHGLFAIKLDSKLDFEWYREGSLGGFDYDGLSKISEGIAMKNGDMVFSGATTTGFFQLGDVKIDFVNGSGYSNLFAFRLSPEGEMIWTRPFQSMSPYYYGKKKDTESEEYAYAMHMDVIHWQEEYLYLTGRFASDSLEIDGRVLEKKLNQGAFVASVDLVTGEEEWGYALSSGYLELYGFDLDASGNVSLMGRTGETQEFELLESNTVPGTDLVFYLGLDYNGQPLWLNNAYLEGISYGLYGGDLEVLADGEVFSAIYRSNASTLNIGGSSLQADYTYSNWLVGLEPDNELGGIASDKAGNPVFPGYVKAFKRTKSGAYPAVDSVRLDEAGGFLFQGLYPGNYTLLAAPNLLEDPDGMPTYYGDAIGWNEAKFFDVFTNTKASGLMDIAMSELAKLTAEDGSGGISGNVSYEEEGTLKSTMARPVTRTSVVLKGRGAVKSTLEEGVVAYLPTDEFGNFHFIHVPDGAYTLIVDIPGLVMLEEHEVDILGNQLKTGLDYTVSNEGIYTYTGVGISVEEHVPFVIYPNPGDGLIQVEFPVDGDYQVRIFNTVGQLVYNRFYSSASGTATVDLREQREGVYLIQVEGDQTSGTIKYVKR